MSNEPDWSQWREANRAMWDERVPIHAASEMYDQDAFRDGKNTICPFEEEEIGDVTGKRLLHLQCHMGQDTLSWARRGAAKVVGLDFSAPAIATAQGLAEDIGIGRDRAEFVVSDVYQAPLAVPDADYDIVYTGIGALDWLPDIWKWAETAASLVAPGGFLYVAEFHPFTHVLGWENGTEILEDYFKSEPMVTDAPGTYTDFEARTVNNVSFERAHTLGDIVTAISAAGLRLEFLHEHDFTLFRRFAGLVPGEHGFLTTPQGKPNLPLMFSLKASRPAA
ncbi:class I SAM-dependent methyltransferase [Glycomyces buryatensis]|uniref:Class I SAM-dependent methyltransferase n=1 Tax=Glycomyces buryatensis TaxID=2570927 RepID=A0A4S8PZ24_9ACTN|nr:class I SAM-dependent methyltransferase [Glycomyces buryatensis]THV36993.1 class I SAM-dependent methyltransferase [Glycomyces buryatensis]